MSYPVNPLPPAHPYTTYPAGPVGMQTVIVQERIQPASTTHIVIAWILAGLTALYWLPWAIAATRHHQNVVAIAVINLFLGWTGVGWLGTLIWACLGVHTRPVMRSAAVFGGYGPPQQLPAPSYRNNSTWPPPALPSGNASLSSLADQIPTEPRPTQPDSTRPYLIQPDPTRPQFTWQQYPQGN